MGTPLQTYKHEAASALGCHCHPPFSFCWQPSAPESSQTKQTCSCCCKTWRATWWTSKQQRTRPGSGQQSLEELLPMQLVVPLENSASGYAPGPGPGYAPGQLHRKPGPWTTGRNLATLIISLRYLFVALW